jgi:hypothetical protein
MLSRVPSQPKPFGPAFFNLKTHSDDERPTLPTRNTARLLIPILHPDGLGHQLGKVPFGIQKSLSSWRPF